ncbi:hypothetical protein BXZ70DRAFT_527243 [Cristinia sonorae]|uniref:Transcription regulator Rua1 C-terminal domain-containing protein n=1 Tax=Cristinia sonorae TaxID=1940300 RepID=A0A8K0UWI7_9AGAR|nr:hypothetical protein BXZ70DRAFT_527243 [Cristinia sonorae]
MNDPLFVSYPHDPLMYPSARSHSSAFLFHHSPHRPEHPDTHHWSQLDAQSPMNPARPQHMRLVAADALLNLSGTPSSPFARPMQNGTPHFPSPAGDIMEKDGIFTPLQPLFQSPGQYWNLTNSISPILRTSSPDAGHDVLTPAHSSRGRQSSRPDTSPESRRRLIALEGLSPLSDVSTLSSASEPDNTPSAPTSSSSSQVTNDASSQTASVITPEDWEPPRRYTTRARIKGSTTLLAETTASSSSRKDIESTPSTSSLSPDSSARKRIKRPRVDVPNSARPAKKPRQETEEAQAGPVVYPRRTFPKHVEMDDQFALLYRQFPVCSYTRHGKRGSGLAGTQWNRPRDVFDLYTPRFVKGRGTQKIGVCPICCESVKRGGENKKLRLSMKFSAYNYHMLNSHGISSTSGTPFSPPLEFRTIERDNVGKGEKSQMRQGKCHKCKKWVPMEGIKDVEAKVKEIFWYAPLLPTVFCDDSDFCRWKHAASCHRGSNIPGETNIFVEDDILKAALAGELDDVDDEDEE